jgi:hypothetical protein
MRLSLDLLRLFEYTFPLAKHNNDNMPIPQLDSRGLLPAGIHDCDLQEIRSVFAWNPHRRSLLTDFLNCFQNKIRPLFPDPVIFDGSYVTDKDTPDDIDIVLDLISAPIARQLQGLTFMAHHQAYFQSTYRVHLWVNLPGVGANDFCAFFQYVGVKSAKFKGLSPRDLKGVLRLT